MSKDISLTIGMLAKTCNVSTPTIRYYEQIGLMPKADRTRSDQRRYGRAAVERLTFIRRSRDFGFSTKQVRVLLDVPSGTSEGCQASREIAQSRVKDVRSKIEDLRALEKALQSLIASCNETCSSGDIATCGAFIEMKMPVL